MASGHYIPLFGGVKTTAWAKAVKTVCSANPIRSLPARDLEKNIQFYLHWSYTDEKNDMVKVSISTL
jgi:hypothetical protein